jgi:cytochrome c oxidase subunit 2
MLRMMIPRSSARRLVGLQRWTLHRESANVKASPSLFGIVVAAGAREIRSAGTRAWVALMFLVACHGPQSSLDARGPGAARALVLFVVFLVICVAFALALWIPLLRGGMRSTPRINERRALFWVLTAGAALPAVTIAALFIYSVVVHGALINSRPASLTVHINGHQFWWSVRYLSSSGTTMLTSANELHIPVGKPVEVRLTSSDVIHSFWVPSLHGKTDMIPGRTTSTWIQADRPGVYRGQCAEFCGLQHARMALLVIAHSAAEFENWLRAEQQLATRAPAHPGQLVFMTFCAVCHTIRGTAARGVAGPDLTHFAGRRTIAAGTLPNHAGALASWIRDPQAIKPGNLMPKIPLSTMQLEQVVQYLGSLR